MQIIANVTVWLEEGGSKGVIVDVTKEMIEEMAEAQALQMVEGLSASTISIEVKNVF